MMEIKVNGKPVAEGPGSSADKLLEVPKIKALLYVTVQDSGIGSFRWR